MKARVAVFLFLVKNDQVLLYFRQNKRYKNNLWSLISGRQENGESAAKAAIREAKEEIDIEIAKKDLQVVHVIHHKLEEEGIEGMDIFFKCEEWKGEIKNNEPEVCGKLEWHKIDSLPENIGENIKSAIEMINSGIIYSELGWDQASETASI